MDWTDIIMAVGLVLVIEGVFYALFPKAARRALEMAIELGSEKLREVGLVAAILGLVLIWLVAG